MSFIQAKPPATYDFYGLIHKALRLSLSDLLVRMGRADPAEEGAVAALVAETRRQCRLSAKHLHHEDVEIHAALEQRCSGATRRLERGHDEHRAAFEELEALLIAIEGDPQGRAALWRRLYLRFSEFVAEDFAHMAEEELVVLPVLQSLFTNEELAGIEQRILAALAPEDVMAYARIMIAGGSHADRVFLLNAFRAAAPPEAYAAVVEIAVRPQLTEAEWARLERDLG